MVEDEEARLHVEVRTRQEADEAEDEAEVVVMLTGTLHPFSIRGREVHMPDAELNARLTPLPALASRRTKLPMIPLPKLETPEEIAAYIAERKRKFPTKEIVAKKVER